MAALTLPRPLRALDRALKAGFRFDLGPDSLTIQIPLAVPPGDRRALAADVALDAGEVARLFALLDRNSMHRVAAE